MEKKEDRSDFKKNTIIFVSFALILIGFLQTFFYKTFCRGFCSVCKDPQLNSCFFLLLFTGIIFIVDGASLYLSYKVLMKSK
ncbi:Uncharacterised protein [uncultured archaeon]|nr:Uncharacterised protein [uncultured archaeon]